MVVGKRCQNVANSGLSTLIKGYESYFRPYFSKPQYKHFSEYLTELVVSENVTVTGINSNFVES